MVPKGDGGSACVDENGVLDFVQGRLSAADVARVDEHADGCLSCRMAIDEAVRTFRERATGVEPRQSIPIPTRFAAGDHLAARYRIVRFIARGGMGEVYEAEDEMLGTRIAVKTVAAAISDNPHVANRLKQEVNLARRITHPNVCRIFDLGVHAAGARSGPSVLFLTMELIAGVSLAARVREQGRFSAEAALPVAKAMAAAIGAAHAAGVVHRDFKSENVMLAGGATGSQRVVVMDFGLARGTWLSTHDSIEGRGLAGTLAYMAPEQLHGQRVGPAADIYALGVVLYEMLTGQLPFVPPEGEAGIAWALWRLSEPAPEVRSLVPDVDPRWNDLVARCLEREVDRRPASADEIVWALEAPSALVLRPRVPAKAAPPAAPAADPAPVSGAAAVASSVSSSDASSARAPATTDARSRRVWLRGGLVMGGLAAVGALVALRAASPGPSHASAASNRVEPPRPVPPPAPADQPNPVPAGVPLAPAGPSHVPPGEPRMAGSPRVGDPPQLVERGPSVARPTHRDRTVRTLTRAEGAGGAGGPAAGREAAPGDARPRSADPEDGFIFK